MCNVGLKNYCVFLKIVIHKKGFKIVNDIFTAYFLSYYQTSSISGKNYF